MPLFDVKISHITEGDSVTWLCPGGEISTCTLVPPYRRMPSFDVKIPHITEGDSVTWLCAGGEISTCTHLSVKPPPWVVVVLGPWQHLFWHLAAPDRCDQPSEIIRPHRPLYGSESETNEDRRYMEAYFKSRVERNKAA